jgi:hypothetical protein
MVEHYSFENYRDVEHPVTGEPLALTFPIGIWIEWDDEAQQILSLWRDWPVCSRNRWGTDKLTRTVNFLFECAASSDEMSQAGNSASEEDFEWYRLGYKKTIEIWAETTLTAIKQKLIDDANSKAPQIKSDLYFEKAIG